MMMTLYNNGSRMEKFWLNGLIEIFGPATVQKWVDHVGGNEPFTLRFIVEREIGVSEARGMFIRSGRASFYVWMRLYAEKLGWQTPEFRLLAGSAKAHRAINDFLTRYQQTDSFEFALTENEHNSQVMIINKPGKPRVQDCAMLLGFIQELHGWANGGKFYRVEETRCQAVGAESCCFRADKKPSV